jgi:hypothetical protein
MSVNKTHKYLASMRKLKKEGRKKKAKTQRKQFILPPHPPSGHINPWNSASHGGDTP